MFLRAVSFLLEPPPAMHPAGTLPRDNDALDTSARAHPGLLREPGRARHSLLPLLLLGLTIAFAGYVRLRSLGVPEFTNDELDHVYVAQSMHAGQGPLLPSGVAYRRGIDISRLAGWGERHVSPPELGARLPSALFGVLDVVVFSLFAWWVAGPWVAVWCALLLAIYPEAVVQSRQVRFYTYQLLYGLIALWAGWVALRRAGAPTTTRDELRQEWIAVVIMAIALALAARVQVTTLSVAAGLGVAFVCAALLDLRARGRPAWRDSPALPLVTAGILVILAGLVAARGLIRHLLTLSQLQPIWVQRSPGSRLFYYYELADAYPVLLALLPVIIVLAFRRNWRLAGYLLAWYAVPVALHSAVFPWKGSRFVLLATPALFLLAGIAATDGLALLRRGVERWLSDLRVVPRLASPVATAVVVVAALAIIVTTPAFGDARRTPAAAATAQRTSWREIAARLRTLPEAASLPLGTTDPIQTLHYVGRVDFSVQLGSRDAGRRPKHHAALPPNVLPSDTLDLYVDVPVITDPDLIRARFRGHPAVLIALDSLRVTFNNVDPKLIRTLAAEGEELCQHHCGSMRLYRWPLGGSH